MLLLLMMMMMTMTMTMMNVWRCRSRTWDGRSTGWLGDIKAITVAATCWLEQRCPVSTWTCYQNTLDSQQHVYLESL